MAKLMNTMTTDLKGLIQSLQSNDVSAIEASASKVGTDADALQALDTSQIDSFETNLLKPYVDSYDANMKKAGFTIQS
jgi:hypothetical protein